MSIELGRRVLAMDLVSSEDFARALFVAVTTGVPLVRSLFARALVSERELARDAEAAGVLSLRQVVPSPELVAQLPDGLCERLGVLPVRLDPFSGVVDFATLDPFDPHLERELAHHLGARVRLLRAPAAALDEALQRLAGVAVPEAPRALPPPAPRIRRLTPASPHGAPRTSVPPPHSDHMPIPLVRRSAATLVAAKPAAPEAHPPRTSRRTLRFAMPPEGAGPPTPGTDRQALLPADSSPPAAPPEAAEPATRRGIGARPTLELGSTRPPPREGEVAWTSIEAAARSVRGGSEPARPTPPHGTPTAEPRTPRRSRRTIGTAPPPPSEPPASASPPSPLGRDPEATLLALRSAAGRDDVVLGALAALRLVARRAAIVAVRKDGYHGYACNAAFGDRAAFADLRVPLGVPSLFATAAAAAVYLGPVPDNAAHAPLLAVMGRASRDLAAVAVRPKGRPALVLVADELGDTTSGTRYMMAIADAAAEALVRILAART